MNNIMNVLETIKKDIEPIVSYFGIDIWDVTFENEGSNKFLRVYIYRKNGISITLDDCESVSHEVSKKLDDVDLIDSRYYLEVSSVGLSRKLTKPEHFINSINKKVILKFKKNFGGIKNLKGILRGFESDKMKIETKDEIFVVPFKNCSYVKLDDFGD